MRLITKAFLLMCAMLLSVSVSAQADLYWVGGSGDWNDFNHWSFTSGGFGGDGVPNIQSNVIFDANSFAMPGETVAVTGNVFCNSMDWTGVTNTPVLDGDPTATINVHGSLTFVTGMRHFFPGIYEFNHSGGTNIFTSGGQVFSSDIIFDGQGEWIFTDPLNVIRNIEFREGVFKTGNNPISAFGIYSNFPTLRLFDFGTSIIQLRQMGPGNPSSAIFGGSNLNWSSSQPSIIFSGERSFLQLEGDANFQFTEVRFDSDNSLLNSMTDLPPTIGSLSFLFNGEIIGNHIINEWTLSMGYTVFLDNGSTQSVSDIFTGDNCDGLASLILKDDGGEEATIFFDFPPFGIDGLFLRGVHADNSDNRTITLFNSQNGGNTGDIWVFQNLNSNNKYWVGGTGDWNDRSHWADSPGGPGGACLPKPNDNVFFDDNSFTGQPNAVVSGITPAFANNFTFTASNFNGRIELPSLYINGNLFLNSLVNWAIPDVFLIGNDQAGNSGNTDVQFISTGPVTLINLISQSQRRVVIESDITLSGTLSVSGRGEDAQFVVNDQTITAERVEFLESQLRVVLSDASIIVTGERVGDLMPLIIEPGITSNVNESASHGDTWILTGMDTGAEVTSLPGSTEVTNPDGNAILVSTILGSLVDITFEGDGVFTGIGWTISSLKLSPGHTYEFDPNSDIDIRVMIAPGTVCSPITIQSLESGRTAEIDFSFTNGLQLEYLLLRDLRANPLVGIYAGDGSADNGNNTGWIFPSETNQRFLGDDRIACVDTSIMLEPFLASEIDRIDWNDGESAALAYMVEGPGNQEVVAHVFFLDGCDIYDTLTVMFDPTFTIDLGMDTTICEGEQLRIDIAIPSVTYDWSTGVTGPIIDITESGTYTVDAARGACQTSDTITVARIEVEDFTLGQDTTLCEDTPYTLQAPDLTSGGYVWSNGSTTSTLTVQDAGIYWVEVGQDRCTLRDSVVVSYDPILNINLGPNTTLCEGQDLSLGIAIADVSYQWSTGDTTPIITVTQSGTYGLQGQRGVCQTFDEVVITRIELEPFSLDQDTTLCENTIYTLQAPTLTTGSYEWSDGTSTSNLMIRDAGTYWVEVDQEGCTTRDSVEVTYDANINLDLGQDTLVCAGDNFQLDAGAGMDSYVWNTGSTDQFLPISTSGNYEVDVIRGACREQTFVFVGVSDIAAFDIGVDATLCEGDTLMLSLPEPLGNESYQWFDGTDDITKNITNDGDFWVAAQEGQCSRRDSINVSFDAAITIDIGNDTTLCEGESLTIEAGLGMDSYLWSTGSSAISIDADTGDTYTVAVSRGACSATDEVVVSVVSIEPFSIGADTILCEGEDLILTYPSTAPPQSLWSDGSRMDSLIVNTFGTYWLEVGTANCSQRDSITISFDPSLNIDIGNDTTLCEGETLELDIMTTVDRITWSTGEIDPTISIASAGMVSMEAMRGACVEYDTLSVAFISLNGLNVGNDTTLCEGQTLSLDANLAGVSQYEWTDVLTGTVVSTSSMLDVTQAGSYEVLVSAERCATSDAITVSFDAALNFPGLGPDTTLCQGASIDYNFTIPNAEYIWQDGSTASNYTTRDQSATYSVQIIRNTCIETDSVVVEVSALPTVDLQGDLNFCEGEERTISANSNATNYLWSDGSTDSTIVVSAVGDYSIIVSDGFCENSDMINVTINPLPVFVLGSDTSICQGNTLNIGLPADPNIVSNWNTGETTSAITVMDAGDYILTITDSNGCEAMDSMTLMVDVVPIFDLPETTGLCEGDAAMVAVDVPLDDVVWSTGETTRMIQVSTEQILWAEASIGNCSFRDSTAVIVQALPIVDLGSDTTICEGLTLRVDATNPSATYTWSTGETSESIDISTAGDYNVLVDIGGCTSSDNIVLTLSPTPFIDLGSDLILCEEESTTLSSGGAQGTVTWSTGETGATISVSDAATYTATADLNGCTAVDEVLVSVEMTPVFTLGEDIAICEQLNTSLSVDLNNVDVLWSTGDNSRSINITQEGTYSATAMSPNGCVFTDEISISNRECQRFALYIPNAFVPLGTSENAFFLISPTEPQNILEYEINIFDRWGNVLYQSADYTVGWDGRTPDYKAQPGVYTYSIKVRYFDDFEDDRTQYMNGSVTVLR